MSSADFGRLAMFPLQSAFLPGEDLPLQIFEPRYAEMVRDCMRDNNPRFGVVLISQGREVGGGDMRCDVGTVARVTECVDVGGTGRFVLGCKTAERIKVCEWLPDDPYPRAVVEEWPDEPGETVSAGQLEDLEDRMMALFERIANARDFPVPDRREVLGSGIDFSDAGERLYALASRIPIGPADRYSVLTAPTAHARLTALGEAVDSVAAIIDSSSRRRPSGVAGNRVQASFEQHAARCQILEVVGRRPVVAPQHSRRLDCRDRPVAAGQPLSKISALFGEQELRDVQPALAQELSTSLEVVRVEGARVQHFCGDPTAGGAELQNPVEQNILAGGRQVGQQSLGGPRGGNRRIESGFLQRRGQSARRSIGTGRYATAGRAPRASSVSALNANTWGWSIS